MSNLKILKEKEVLNKDFKNFKSTEFGELSILMIDGKEYFPATQCAKILGYSNPHKAIRDHCKTDGCTNRSVIDNLNRPQKMKFINEGNLYRLIVLSKLPSSEKFEKWIFDEVLPLIRKTGGYVETNREDEFIDKYFPSFEETTKLAMIHDLTKTNREFKEQIAQLKPQAQAYQDLMQAQGYLQMIDVCGVVNKGRNSLFQFLRNQKILTKQSSYNVPYEKYKKNGMFKTISSIDEKNHFHVITLISPKGLNYIYNLLRKNEMLDEFNSSFLLEMQKNEVSA